MANDDEKAKKLKEIQERLAEIQSKSPTTAKTEKKSQPEVKPSPTPPTKKSDPAPIKKPEIKSEVGKSDNIPKTTPSKPKNEPITKEVKQEKIETKKEAVKAKKVEPKRPEKKKTDNQTAWSENKTKYSSKNKPRKSKQSGNKLSKVYTIVSLIVTAAVVGYFLFTYFSDSSGIENAVTEKIPEEPIEEKSKDEQTEIQDDNSDTEDVDEIVEKEDNEVMQSRSQPTRIKETKQVETPKTSINANGSGDVPSGFIISYASNSSTEMAEKNVQRLMDKGFQANYYFMPDHRSGSPQLYKVYVGPFPNESAALPTFKKIIALNDKAFILKMD